MNWDKLSNYYKKNETNILKMWNNNFEKISKTLIERAYEMEEIEILTKLSPFDLVRTNSGEEYEVVYITGNGNVVSLEKIRQMIIISKLMSKIWKKKLHYRGIV